MITKIKEDSSGFTLIEVLVSMAITVIVMGAVFGLLTQGQKSFQREPQIADLQQSARSALDMVSRDVLQAGSSLPPEFPSFTPKILDGSVGDQGVNPDVLEIVGSVQSPGVIRQDPEIVENFDGFALTGSIMELQSVLQAGDMVVIYNNEPNNSQWVTTFVQTVTPTGAQVDLTFGPSYGGTTIPAHFSRYIDFNVGFVTPISVVRYDTVLNGQDLILRRQVDFQNAVPVGMVDDFQVTYLVGTQPQVEQNDPPHPHPLPTAATIQPQSVISGVRVTVAARSEQENLEGATQGASGNYIRKTFSSNISPRNILGGLQERTGGVGAN
jgi:prepilin-type N-terminal cleavage/methylation domain-containing protein